jgi:predicted transcriptional regulator
VKRLGILATETETRIPRVRSEIAERLVKELGMSLAEVARLLGVSTLAVSKILHRIEQETN